MENILSPRKIKAQEEKIDKKNNPNSKSPKTKREVEWRKVTLTSHSSTKQPQKSKCDEKSYI